MSKLKFPLRRFASQQVRRPVKGITLKSKDELVAKVQTKYALDKTQAQKDVDAFAKGRQL